MPSTIAAARPAVMPAPCVGLTIYPSGGMRATARAIGPLLDRLARAAAPGDLAITLHDPVTGDEGRVLDAIRARGLRLWSAFGANPIVRRALADGIQAALDEVGRWAIGAAAASAEVVEPNPERNGADPARDWVLDRPGDAALLPPLASGIVRVCRDAAPRAAIAITTHDLLEKHPLPWPAWCGRDGVDILSCQHYVDTPERVEDHRDALARFVRGCASVQAQVRKGVVRPDLGPDGPGFVPMGQGHGVTEGAVAAILDVRDSGRIWAAPSRIDARGVAGIEAVLLARRECGRAAGAVARLQARHNLKPDGVVGPKTLALVQRLL